MTADVQSSWDRMITWLRGHSPATAEGVNGPATAKAIDEADWAVGVPLPADLRALYRAADGMRSHPRHVGDLLPPFYQLLPLEEALRFHRSRVEGFADREDSEWWGTEEEADTAPAGTQGFRWSRHWLPIATNHCGDVLFADLRYGRFRGCVMKYDKYEGADRRPMWPSVSAMLAEVADALEHDGVAAGRRPYVDAEGRLEWRDPVGLWIDFFPLRGDAPLYELMRFADRARAGELPDPRAAELIVARAAQVTDALTATAETLATGGAARYDDPNPQDEETLRGYAAAHGGLAGLIDHLIATATRLQPLAGPYVDAYEQPYVRGQVPPMVPATVRESGDIVIDGPVSWPGLLSGLGYYLLKLADELQSR
ncbi:SMI1/KNR4 family protein [Actinoallomurus purpureus]|uniref:SMI1/KNR4 family protein n=1 Tax=Actinoallomurus purpureus TaxID=478114 RepID=UPI002093630C|nr:SMI1/KNR4 family protein [Actinoallomurus purpureus]MCO6010705.1 SMI1/KNR4 family protein [Actinoallomurus purpureus]